MEPDIDGPIIHDGTGVGGDPTTARRMFRMTADHHDIDEALKVLNELEAEIVAARMGKVDERLGRIRAEARERVK